MNYKTLSSLGTLALAAVLANCAPVTIYTPPPAGPSVPTELVQTTIEIVETVVPAERDRVFEAFLAVAQRKNLSLDVLEKASGLLQFEAVSLSPSQLDRYCGYVYRYQSTKEPIGTFVSWNTKAIRVGQGAVAGRIILNVLVAENGAFTNASIRVTATAANRTESFSCQSTKVLEQELLQAVNNEISK